MQVTYRPGRKEDAPLLAQLMHDASAGVADYLYQGLVPGSTAVDLLARGLAQDQRPHSYRESLVAEADGRVVGLALSYPAHFHRMTPGMRSFFPAERLELLRPIYETRLDGSYFLDAMSVDPRLRRHGIGRGLVERTKEKARDEGFDVLSLLVYADNTPAVELYRRCGFETVTEAAIGQSPWFRFLGPLLLMTVETVSA